MVAEDNAAGPDEPENEVVYARGRRPDRTYVSKSFPLRMPASSPDYGQPTRYVRKVFDNTDPSADPQELEEWTIPASAGGRVQLTLQVVRESGRVRKLRLDKVPTGRGATELIKLLELDREGAGRLIDVIRQLDQIPVEGGRTVRVDEDLIHDLLTDPEAISALYRRNAEGFRHAIETDASSRDIIALKRRQRQLDEFRRLLNEPAYFESKRSVLGAVGRERVWQDFLEDNPWILGVGLSGQLLTSWSGERLEQTVAGFSVGGAGKRVDALLRTSGRVRSMVFAEIKHHETDLLRTNSYRPECWVPSDELTGGVVQVQQTVDRAIRQLGSRLDETDNAGALIPGQYTYLLRPRSFLIVGRLDEFYGDSGGLHESKFRSFELFRRHIQEPEILTFDELLARAEWHVDTAERQA